MNGRNKKNEVKIKRIKKRNERERSQKKEKKLLSKKEENISEERDDLRKWKNEG